MKNKRKISIYIALLTFIIISFIFAGITFSKYFADRNLGNQQIDANDFYFTVDLLGDSDTYHDTYKSYDLYGDSEKEIPFKVQNYYDSLRINKASFDYEVKTEVFYDDNYQPVLTSVSSNDNSFVKDVKEDESYILTLPSGFKNATSVKLIIFTTKPYEKEMTITFNLFVHDSAVTYKLEDTSNSPYATLLVYCNEDINKKGLLIDWSSINLTSNIFQIDMTNNYIIDGNKFETNIVDPNIGYLVKAYNTLNIKQGEVIEILFFKTDSSLNYSISETSASLEDGVYVINLTLN